MFSSKVVGLLDTLRSEKNMVANIKLSEHIG